MSVIHNPPVRPELVEGLPSCFQPLAEGGQGFDRLSPNGEVK